MKTLENLYIDELSDLHSAETQLIAALPKMAEAASSEDLKQGLALHLEQTKEQLNRLNEIFADLDEKPSGEVCEAMAGLQKEGKKVLKDFEEGSVRDAAIIGASQRIEHYEMAAYGTTMAFAEKLGHKKHVKLLQTTLKEEVSTSESLTEIATNEVNDAALKESKDGSKGNESSKSGTKAQSKSDKSDDDSSGSQSKSNGAENKGTKATSKSDKSDDDSSRSNTKSNGADEKGSKIHSTANDSSDKKAKVESKNK